MVLTVFGASGMVGKRIVGLAIAKGHSVRAFGRNITELIDEDLRNDQLIAIKGSVFNSKEVFEAISGADAVISALGGATDGQDKTRSLGMKTIVHEMEKSSTKRIVALGGLGVLDAGDGTFLLEKEDYPEAFKAVGNEHLKAYQHLKESNLDWTFVCAPNIKNEDDTGRYITSDNISPKPNQNYINAGDLALFMVSEVEKNEHNHVRVGISAIV